MFGSLGAPEIAIIAVVVILIFGVGKISGLGRELGSSIKEFRRAVKDEDQEAAKAAAAPPQYTQVQQPQQPVPPAAPQAQPQAPSGDSKPPQVF
ncbi:MAG: twin-arginine translocase TatA/TatE family subunit [Dehalococcoidia bacterium]